MSACGGGGGGGQGVSASATRLEEIQFHTLQSPNTKLSCFQDSFRSDDTCFAIVAELTIHVFR